MKKILLLTIFLSFALYANATLYIIVVDQPPPAFVNLCPGDTLRFSGDSTNQLIYGTIMVIIDNINMSLDRWCPISSDSNLATTCDFILIPGDVQWEYTPSIGNGSIVFNCISDIDNFKNELAFDVFPNPAKDMISIKNSRKANLTLWSFEGKLLLSLEVSGNTTIDISCYASGIYLLKLQTEDGIEMRKVVKK